MGRKAKDDPRRSEMCGKAEACYILDCGKQHVRNLVKKYKRVKDYYFGYNSVLYNRKDLEEELCRTLKTTFDNEAFKAELKKRVDAYQEFERRSRIGG